MTDKYHSKFWKQVKERETKEAEDASQYKEDIKDRQKKRIEYARNAMSIYKPKISKKKRLEMTMLINSMENPQSLSNTKRTVMTTQHKKNQSMVTSVDKAVGSDAASQTNHKRKRYEMKPLDEK